MHEKTREALKKILNRILEYKNISISDFLKQAGYNSYYFDYRIDENNVRIHEMYEMIVKAGATIHLKIVNEKSKAIKEISGTDIDEMAKEMGQIVRSLVLKKHGHFSNFARINKLKQTSGIVNQHLNIRSKCSLDYIFLYAELSNYRIKTRAELQAIQRTI